MTWTFPSQDYTLYQRNPLETVVAQLRFQPILKIQKGIGIESFQDQIRSDFPAFNEVAARKVSVGLDGQVTTNDESVYEFLRPADGCKIQLSSTSLLVETQRHVRREHLIADFSLALDAIRHAYTSIVGTRLGVRYVNVISPEQISVDLGRKVDWLDLIEADYLSIPGDQADLNDTQLATQITSMLDPGSLTLRYGIEQENALRASPVFIFDVDRFIETGLDAVDIPQMVMRFTADIFSLFHTAITDNLREWMSNE